MALPVLEEHRPQHVRLAPPPELPPPTPPPPPPLRPLVVLSEGELNDESVAEVDKLRGYKIQAGEQREIEFETPGDYVIDE